MPALTNIVNARIVARGSAKSAILRDMLSRIINDTQGDQRALTYLAELISLLLAEAIQEEQP